MSGSVQGQGGYGSGIMDGDAASWMHEDDGMWVLILLVLGFVGLAAWIVKQKTK